MPIKSLIVKQTTCSDIASLASLPMHSPLICDRFVNILRLLTETRMYLILMYNGILLQAGIFACKLGTHSSTPTDLTSYNGQQRWGGGRVSFKITIFVLV